MTPLLTLPDGPCVLSDLTIPLVFCGPDLRHAATAQPAPGVGMLRGALGIAGGRFAVPADDWPRIDAAGLLALPPFVDAHVHLDKAFTVHRSGLGNGTLLGAIGVMTADAETWTLDDLAHRMQHGAQRALSHGTGRLRSHLDTVELPDDTPAWDVLADLQADFADRLELQPVALGAVERALQDDFDTRCRQIARRGGVLGAFVPPGPVPEKAIRALLAGADRHGLDVDFHVDENLGSGPPALATIADVMIETGLETRVVAGHCCKLSLMEGDALTALLDRVARAGIHVIALPNTNSYLQDRRAGASPRRRGIAPLQEMMAAGIAVSVASDNVQDAFYPFGDFDMLEVLRSMIVLGQLDNDLAGALDLGLGGGAAAMGQDAPRLEIGMSADLTLFRAENWFGLLSKMHPDRMILRRGFTASGRRQTRGAA